jgi:four helix bundle protein
MLEKKSIISFHDLHVWQLGMEIVEQIYHLTRHFPKEEVYGLTSQMRRAAVSIPSNIAEGHARAFTKEYQRHLSIAVGSLAEVETLLQLTARFHYGERTAIDRILDLVAEERRMLRGLQRSLRAKSNQHLSQP